MTELTVKKLEEAFAFGASDKEACFYADISHQTLYNYQENNPEFVERKEALKQRPILLARQSVVRGLEGNPELALKFLERKLKKEFGTRQEIEHGMSDPVGDILRAVGLLKGKDDDGETPETSERASDREAQV